MVAKIINGRYYLLTIKIQVIRDLTLKVMIKPIH